MSDPTDNDDLDMEFDQLFSDLDDEDKAPAPGAGSPDTAASAASAPVVKAPPSRGLYRPSEPPPPIGERTTAVPRTPRPPAFEPSALPTGGGSAGASASDDFDPMTSWDDDEPNDATRVVALPAEMLAALGRRPPSERPTAPPPAGAPDLEPNIFVADQREDDAEEQDDEEEDDDDPVLEFAPLALPEDGAPDALSDLLGDLLSEPLSESAAAGAPAARSGTEDLAGDALWAPPPPYEPTFDAAAAPSAGESVVAPANEAGSSAHDEEPGDPSDVTPHGGFDVWAGDDDRAARGTSPSSR